MFQSSSKDPAVLESECGTGAKCSYGVSIIINQRNRHVGVEGLVGLGDVVTG
jgi:hypothetical protein